MSSCVTSVCNIWVSFFTDIAFPPFLLRMTRPSKVVDPSPPRPFAERRCSQHCFFSVQQVMPHLEWWIAIYKGRWNMIFAYLCRLETFLKDICLQTDEPWTPHAVHKHAAFTTMFSCSIVSCLSLFAYLLLPHPWYVRPVRKGTSDIEPGIPDSFNCPTSHMRQKSKQENQVEFVWLSWMQLSWFSAN